MNLHILFTVYLLNYILLVFALFSYYQFHSVISTRLQVLGLLQLQLAQGYIPFEGEHKPICLRLSVRV